MLKVRILHGSQSGGYAVLERAAAESAIASGAAELVDVVQGEEPAAAPPKKTGQNKKAETKGGAGSTV